MKHIVRICIILCLACLYSQAQIPYITTYEYDTIGRLTKVTYPDSSSITYSYDRNGNILSMISVVRNNPPTAASATIVTDEDTPSPAVVPMVTDPDSGDVHTFFILTQPSNGLAELVSNALIYIPDRDYFGGDSFTFRATDQGGLDVEGLATVTVNPVNDAPGRFERLLPNDRDEVSDRNVEFQWTSAIDVDQDPINYSLRVKTADLDEMFITSDTSRRVDFEGLGVSNNRDTVRWSLIASDGELNMTPDNGEGMFIFTTISGVEDPDVFPVSYQLKQNYPNPFHPQTTIDFKLPNSGNVKLQVYNVYGEEIATLRNDWFEPGSYSIVWNAAEYPTGVYLCRLQADQVVLTRIMVLMR